MDEAIAAWLAVPLDKREEYLTDLERHYKSLNDVGRQLLQKIKSEELYYVKH